MTSDDRNVRTRNETGHIRELMPWEFRGYELTDGDLSP
jgi:hypothetical protein